MRWATGFFHPVRHPCLRPDEAFGTVPPLMAENEQTCGGGAGRAFIQALVPAAIGAFLVYKGRTVAGGVLCGIGAVVLVCGLFIPAAFARLEQFGRWLGRAVATALTWVLLVPVFYLVFVPGRLILLARGQDPLCRQFPTRLRTYWIPRKPVGGNEGYARQF